MITPYVIKPPNGDQDLEASPFTPKSKSPIDENSVRIPITSPKTPNQQQSKIRKIQPAQMPIDSKDKSQKNKDPHKRCFGMIDDRDGFLINLCKLICITMFLPFALVAQCVTLIYEKCIIPCCEACGRCCKKFGTCFGKCCAAICDAFANCLTAIGEAIWWCISPICNMLGKCFEAIFNFIGKCCEKMCSLLESCFTKIFELIGKCCEGIYKGLSILCSCVANTISSIFDIISVVCVWIYKNIITTFLMGMLCVVKTVWDKVVYIFTNIVRFIKAGFKMLGAVLAKINKFLGRVFGVIYKYVIKPILDGIIFIARATGKCFIACALLSYKGITYVFLRILEVFKMIGSLIKKCLKAIYKGITFILGKIWKGITFILEKLWGGITFILEKLWEGMTIICSFIWACLEAFYEYIIQPILNFIAKCCEKICQFIGKVCELAYRCIGYICKGLYKYLVHPIYKCISYILNGIWKLFRASMKASYKIICYCCRKIYEGLKILYHYTLRPVLLVIRGVYRFTIKCAKSIGKAIHSHILKPIGNFFADLVKALGECFREAVKTRSSEK